MSQPDAAPVTFGVTYPISLSRSLLLLKTFLGWLYVGVPHGIILYLYGIFAGLASLIAFFAILFTRQYPLGLFNFVVGYLRWNARVSAYLTFMVDKYPPFSSTDPGHPVELEVANPEKLSRPLAVLKLFLGWLYVGIPHGVALIFYGIAVLVVVFIAWWAILFTGRFPPGLFRFVEGFYRWSSRVNVYLLWMRDEYPPFNGRPSSPVGSPDFPPESAPDPTG